MTRPRMTEQRYNDIKAKLELVAPNVKLKQVAVLIGEPYSSLARVKSTKDYAAYRALIKSYSKYNKPTPKAVTVNVGTQLTNDKDTVELPTDYVTKADLQEAVVAILNGVQAITGSPTKSEIQNADDKKRGAWWNRRG